MLFKFPLLLILWFPCCIINEENVLKSQSKIMCLPKLLLVLPLSALKNSKVHFHSVGIEDYCVFLLAWSAIICKYVYLSLVTVLWNLCLFLVTMHQFILLNICLPPFFSVNITVFLHLKCIFCKEHVPTSVPFYSDKLFFFF